MFLSHPVPDDLRVSVEDETVSITSRGVSIIYTLNRLRGESGDRLSFNADSATTAGHGYLKAVGMLKSERIIDAYFLARSGFINLVDYGGSGGIRSAREDRPEIIEALSQAAYSLRADPAFDSELKRYCAKLGVSKMLSHGGRFNYTTDIIERHSEQMVNELVESPAVVLVQWDKPGVPSHFKQLSRELIRLFPPVDKIAVIPVAVHTALLGAGDGNFSTNQAELPAALNEEQMEALRVLHRDAKYGDEYYDLKNAAAAAVAL